LKVELMELREDRIKFLLEGVSQAFANGVRRACMSEVPTLAVDEIGLYDNTSVLFDENLGLRIGLVPLKTEDLDLYRSPEECDCGGVGCPACRVDFMLTAEGPCTVYSRDMKFNDPTVKAAFDNIPLVVLGDGEKLVVEGYATKRTGRDHAKWQAGTLCGYKNLPRIEIHECTGCGKCVEVCPRMVLAMNDAGQVEVKDLMSCSLCKLCVEACEAGAIKVIPQLDSFVVVIESDGSIKAKDQVERAAESIRKRAQELMTKLEELT